MDSRSCIATRLLLQAPLYTVVRCVPGSIGMYPIPGARNLRQLQDNLAALSWRLDGADVALLDGACANSGMA